jgi:hypothetical protein
MDSATDTLSWTHAASGTSRAVLVAISWQQVSLDESLDLVTYGGIPMALLGSSGSVSLFCLVNPPTGSKTVTAAWSGPEQKAAVGASISLVNVLQTPQTATVRAASGGGTTASVTAKGTTLNGLAIAALFVDNSSSTSVSATLGAGLTELWNIGAGTVGHSNRLIGAGAD